ncbi:MAG: NUDIX hydrolase [Bacillati bacterium ANGP1]|uniref:NUDIX hydrolase n=1 Tax=Candidatus Segetimicrobium genomatis TaxID=2569760 RepID=A0A537JTI5_9BACT|nr:MAG: NUDIX hydrolase [Terrabacteria group bacterium ANGP1]
MRKYRCLRCGTPLRRAREAGRTRPVLTCPRCGWIHWNNPAPTASVLILRRGRVLLIRRAFAPARGLWDIPGGFIEPGETAEQAARREAREELGVAVRLERVLGIYPDVYGPEKRPSLNIYYLARMRGDGSAVRAGDDAAAFAWFPLRALPRGMAFMNTREALRQLKRDLGVR